MPYKRFAAPWLFLLAKQYLNVPDHPKQEDIKQHTRTRTTYRSAVQHDRQKIGYPLPRSEEASGEESFHQPVVSPTLLWRFLGWLGSLTLTLDKARELILKHDPNSTCHRTGGGVDPFKARSAQQLATLETARQLLLVIPEWEDCFGRPLFPQFATRSGFS